MKRRCVPLRADHELLTPDTHTLSGVRLHPVIQVRFEGVASSSGHLSDSSSSESAVRSSRRLPLASPTRLRFEDETETEVESRYLERQRQRRHGGQRWTGVLVSKPNLNQYVNCRAEAEHVDRQQRGLTPARGLGQCDPCGTVLGGGVNLNLRLHPPEDQGRSLHRRRLNLRTEPIRETYIGSVTPGETDGRGGRIMPYANNHVRRTTNQVELNGNQMTIPQATPTTDLPINPYAPDQLTMHTSNCPYTLSPPPVTSSLMSQSIRLSSTKAEQDSPEAKPHIQLRSAAELKERTPSVEEGGLDLRMKNSSSSSGRSSETTAESQAPAKSGSSSDGQVRQPVRAQVHGDDTSVPDCLISRDEPSRLCLRRLFSNVRLSRTRPSSLDRLCSRPHPLEVDPTLPGSGKSSGLLKKTPPVQSLIVGSPFLQLRKSSSVESFVMEQKKKTDRSTDYRPAADQ
ncbi:hypothetical protein VZT92_021572 [Zoarces viviparus]|uniref:DUF4685 domain-containing protein n=1 Tax=Zoarces viviparus TaxID=48416 RepID=A0AAW1E8A2_ZOAVI